MEERLIGQIPASRERRVAHPCRVKFRWLFSKPLHCPTRISVYIRQNSRGKKRLGCRSPCFSDLPASWILTQQSRIKINISGYCGKDYPWETKKFGWWSFADDKRLWGIQFTCKGARTKTKKTTGCHQTACCFQKLLPRSHGWRSVLIEVVLLGICSLSYLNEIEVRIFIPVEGTLLPAGVVCAPQGFLNGSGNFASLNFDHTFGYGLLLGVGCVTLLRNSSCPSEEHQNSKD